MDHNTTDYNHVAINIVVQNILKSWMFLVSCLLSIIIVLLFKISYKTNHEIKNNMKIHA